MGSLPAEHDGGVGAPGGVDKLWRVMSPSMTECDAAVSGRVLAQTHATNGRRGEGCAGDDIGTVGNCIM